MAKRLRHYSKLSISTFFLHSLNMYMKVNVKQYILRIRRKVFISRKQKRCKKLVYLYSPRKLGG